MPGSFDVMGRDGALADSLNALNSKARYIWRRRDVALYFPPQGEAGEGSDEGREDDPRQTLPPIALADSQECAHASEMPAVA
jgi:hypothetical protein